MKIFYFIFLIHSSVNAEENTKLILKENLVQWVDGNFISEYIITTEEIKLS